MNERLSESGMDNDAASITRRDWLPKWRAIVEAWSVHLRILLAGILIGAAGRIWSRRRGDMA